MKATNEHGQTQRCPPGISGGQLRRRKIGILDRATNRGPERREHRSANSSHLRWERRRNPAVPGEHAHRGRCMESGKTYEDGSRRGTRSDEHRHCRTVVRP
ncbi:MAG TPA: hypothetical protein VH760_09335, partial [Gaiellaceae bacterium]